MKNARPAGKPAERAFFERKSLLAEGAYLNQPERIVGGDAVPGGPVGGGNLPAQFRGEPGGGRRSRCRVERYLAEMAAIDEHLQKKRQQEMLADLQQNFNHQPEK